jgi:hypothetical protein
MLEFLSPLLSKREGVKREPQATTVAFAEMNKRAVAPFDPSILASTPLAFLGFIFLFVLEAAEDSTL